MLNKHKLKELLYEEKNNPIFLFNDMFCDTLKSIRIDKGLTQKKLSEMLNVPVSTYANWEQGRREPSIYDIYNLISVLDVNANQLFNVDID